MCKKFYLPAFLFLSMFFLSAINIFAEDYYQLDLDPCYKLIINDDTLVYKYPSGLVHEFEYEKKNDNLVYYYDENTCMEVVLYNNCAIVCSDQIDSKFYIKEGHSNEWQLCTENTHEQKSDLVFQFRTFNGITAVNSETTENIQIRVEVSDYSVSFQIYLEQTNLLKNLAHAVVNCSMSIKTENGIIYFFPVSIFPGKAEMVFTGSHDDFYLLQDILINENSSVLIKKHLDYYKFDIKN